MAFAAGVPSDAGKNTSYPQKRKLLYGGRPYVLRLVSQTRNADPVLPHASRSGGEARLEAVFARAVGCGRARGGATKEI